MRLLVALGLVGWLLLTASGCFNPDEPLCSFSCSDDHLCPDDYQCLGDGYCHLHGDPRSCSFPDAAVAPDLGISSLTDLGATDGPATGDALGRDGF